MVHGVGPGADVESPAVGKVWLAAKLFDSIHQLTDEQRSDKGRVTQFTEVQLHCHEVVFRDHLVETRCIEEPADLVQ